MCSPRVCEVNRQCGRNESRVGSYASATVPPLGIQILLQYVPARAPIITRKGFDPRSDSNSNANLHLHSIMTADDNATTLQQFHSGIGQDGEESMNFVSLFQGPMTSTSKLSSALSTTSSLSTSLSTSTSTFSSDPTATSILLPTSLSSNSSSTSTYSINQTEVKHTSVACHSAEVATSFPVSFVSRPFTAADAQVFVRMRRWREVLQRARGLWCLIMGWEGWRVR